MFINSGNFDYVAGKKKNTNYKNYNNNNLYQKQEIIAIIKCRTHVWWKFVIGDFIIVCQINVCQRYCGVFQWAVFMPKKVKCSNVYEGFWYIIF